MTTTYRIKEGHFKGLVDLWQSRHTLLKCEAKLEGGDWFGYYTVYTGRFG